MKELNRDKIIKIIETFESAVEGSVVLLNKLTMRHKDEDFVDSNDSKGFSRVDKKQGEYYASWVNSGNHLSGHHLNKCRDMVKKYWKQIGSNKSFQEKFKCYPEEVLDDRDEFWCPPEFLLCCFNCRLTIKEREIK